MVLLRIRIDASPTSTHDSVLKWVTDTATSYALFHHMVNDNSHYHLFMDCPMIMSAPSMRYKVKTTFNLESVQFSVKECSKDRINEYIQYCYNTKHGNVSTLLGTNLPDSDITNAQARASDVSEAYAKANKSRAKTVTLYDMAREVADMFKDSYDPIFSRKPVIAMIFKVLHKYCKVHDSFLIKKVYETVEYMLDPERAQTRMEIFLGV